MSGKGFGVEAAPVYLSLPLLPALGAHCMAQPVVRGIRSAQYGILVNATLAMAKLIAGLVGNTYALVADAVESTADIFSSLVVWGGLHIASRDPDDEFPFGYGKAESLAAAVVALMLIGAAIGIGIQAVRELRVPHRPPAPWTLLVLVTVVVVKFALSRRVHAVSVEVGSTAVRADAWHHMSDAITSAAAFIGISIAVAGGPAWARADDWAALAASGVIAFNGLAMLRPAFDDLMDRVPGPEIVQRVRGAAATVPGVLAVEKLAMRRMGMTFRLTIHVQADPLMSLEEAHVLSGRVKGAVRGVEPRVSGITVHMEPFTG